jgi:hypothetical protein
MNKTVTNEVHAIKKSTERPKALAHQRRRPAVRLICRLCSGSSSPQSVEGDNSIISSSQLPPGLPVTG